MTWAELEAVAPELAGLGRERLEQAHVALLGTLRGDGSPRISPVEPYLSGGELLFGAMTWSQKAHDLVRDPRCVLHSAVTGPDSGEGELKLYGRALVADQALRDGCSGGWWLQRRRAEATVFALNIDRAAFVSWDTVEGEMTLRRWPPVRGVTETRRPYP